MRWSEIIITILSGLLILSLLCIIYLINKINDLKHKQSILEHTEEKYQQLSKEHEGFVKKCGNALKVIDGSYKDIHKKIPPGGTCFSDNAI